MSFRAFVSPRGGALDEAPFVVTGPRTDAGQAPKWSCRDSRAVPTARHRRPAPAAHRSRRLALRLLLLLPTSACSSLAAVEAPWGPLLPSFAEFDLSGDGCITHAEYRAVVNQRFRGPLGERDPTAPPKLAQPLDSLRPSGSRHVGSAANVYAHSRVLFQTGLDNAPPAASLAAPPAVSPATPPVASLAAPPAASLAAPPAASPADLRANPPAAGANASGAAYSPNPPAVPLPALPPPPPYLLSLRIPPTLFLPSLALFPAVSPSEGTFEIDIHSLLTAATELASALDNQDVHEVVLWTDVLLEEPLPRIMHTLTMVGKCHESNRTEYCVINAQRHGRVLLAQSSNANLTLRFLHLTGGLVNGSMVPPVGAGIAIINDATAVLEDCYITNCTVMNAGQISGGGGLSIMISSYLRMERCVVKWCVLCTATSLTAYVTESLA
eukprot:gene1260-1842_t